MVKLFHHVLFSRVLERVNDQEMRDGKGVDTIRDSCYHKEKGAEKTWEGWGAAHTSQTLLATKNYLGIPQRCVSLRHVSLREAQ